MGHPFHIRAKEKAIASQTTELYRRRLVRTDRQRSELQVWLEKGGMNVAFHRVRRAYEEAFFSGDDVRTPFSFALSLPPGSAGFSFTLGDSMPDENHYIMLDCLMAQIRAMAGFHPVQAERWISRDEELGCDYHQCYTFHPEGGRMRRWLNFFMGRSKSPVLLLNSVYRNGTIPRIEIVWKGSVDQPHRLHSMMERWLRSTPERIDFSYLYQKKQFNNINKINKLWK